MGNILNEKWFDETNKNVSTNKTLWGYEMANKSLDSLIWELELETAKQEAELDVVMKLIRFNKRKTNGPAK